MRIKNDTEVVKVKIELEEELVIKKPSVTVASLIDKHFRKDSVSEVLTSTMKSLFVAVLTIW